MSIRATAFCTSGDANQLLPAVYEADIGIVDIEIEVGKLRLCGNRSLNIPRVADEWPSGCTAANGADSNHEPDRAMANYSIPSGSNGWVLAAICSMWSNARE